MTGFVDPHYLGGAPSPQQSANPLSPLGANPAYPSPIVSMGNIYGRFTIPYPSVNAAGSVPPALSWIILANCSPNALLVGGQMNLGMLMPFTADKFYVAPTSGGVPLQIVPLTPVEFPNPSGAFTSDNESLGNVFATWFEHEPAGAYPAHIGNNRNNIMQTLDLFTNTTPAVGNVVRVVDPEAWMQTLAYRVMGQGGAYTANGFQVTIQDQSPNPVLLLQHPIGVNGQWGYLPINSVLNGVQFTFTPVLNSVAGGTFAGFIEIVGLAGPVTSPHLGPINAAAFGVSARMGLQVEVTVPATTTSTILAEPVTGTMYRVRSISATFTVAPGSNQGLVLRGTNAAIPAYWRGLSGTAIATFHDPGVNFLVGSATARADPAEGLTFTNNANQNCIVLLNYDIIPYSIVGNVLAGSG